jgi:DNA-binding NtrC family response regulator
MVVDNDSDIIYCMRALLQQKGYDVDTFVEPELALKKFSAGKYDVVIADVKMPKISGLQFARMIDSIDEKTKIILMTAFNVKKEEFEKVMPSTRIDAFIKRPIGVPKLLDHVEALCNHKRQDTRDSLITSFGLGLAFSAMSWPSEMPILL